MVRAADAGIAAAIRDIWEEHLSVARAMEAISADVAVAAETIGAALRTGGQLLVAGNGGSAADAQHIAA